MVITCGKKKVAIECDGERWHCGEEKIREDMERQTILERLGWQFIRIRGSEYYRDPIKTMENVVNELKKKEIEPESIVEQEIKPKETDLLYRVKKMAHEIIYHTSDGFELNDNIIQVALDPKNDIIGTFIETPKDIIDSDVKKSQFFNLS